MAIVDSTSQVDGEQRVLIPDVSWDFYKRFCDEIGERPLQLSFTEGMLQIMVTNPPHEFYKKVLAKLLEVTVLECNIPVRSGGNMTFQRDDLKKGFEPDECWWIANERIARGKSKFNWEKDPPPDLAIEIEISHSLVNRISIYAAIGVPEIWRFNGKELRFCLLQENGEYLENESSLSIPFLKPGDLLPYLALDDQRDETTRLRQYIRWLRDQGHSA